MKYGMFYNFETVGDILMIVFDSVSLPTKVVKKNDVVALYKDSTLIGYNFLNISKDIKIKANGLIPICNHKVTDILNHILVNEGFEKLDYLDHSGFVVAKIIEMEDHPESEHLHVLKVDVGNNNILQIVCGSFNAKVGLKVVCATPFTFMPNGLQIIPNELLGVSSNGMLCSGRELNFPGYENIRGLYILDDKYNVGDDFFNY